MNFNLKELEIVIESIIKKITHDLSNPLTAIINISELLGGDCGGDMKQINALKILESSSSNLYRKINSIRYLYISSENQNPHYDDEIFFEILNEFETRNNFELKMHLDEISQMNKKMTMYLLNIFCYFFKKNSIVEISSDKEKKINFSFFVDISSKENVNNCDEIFDIIKFLMSEVNFENDKKYLNPIDIYIFLFKILLKNSKIIADIKIENNEKFIIKFTTADSKN